MYTCLVLFTSPVAGCWAVSQLSGLHTGVRSMARAANSTGFEDQVDFKSLAGLLKYNRHPIAKEPTSDSIWRRKVNFAPRYYRHSSPPRLQNFVCHYRPLTPATDARKKAEERAAVEFLPTSVFRSSTRQKSMQTRMSLPSTRFATVFRIARPFDVKLRAAKTSSDHCSPYKDPEMFEYREVSMQLDSSTELILQFK